MLLWSYSSDARLAVELKLRWMKWRATVQNATGASDNNNSCNNCNDARQVIMNVAKVTHGLSAWYGPLLMMFVMML